jgi:DNA polymerase-4
MLDAALTILHVVMDAFFASVEQRDRPELQGRPVIVGGVEGRGVVCAASYEARPFGVRSAMPISQARRLCPQAVYLPLRMQHYAAVSVQLRELLFSFTPLVEPLSLDEAFLDVGGCEGLFGPAPEIARQIKDRIRAKTRLTASVGVAPNKFLAKLASDHGKPDGLVVVQPDRIEEFLSPLPVNRIWGVGPKAEKRLHELAIETIGQLVELPEQVLIDHLGDMGRYVWHLAHGDDDRQVIPDREAKSISTETTFGHDIDDLPTLRGILLELTDQLASRLRHTDLQARTIELKIRSSDFRTRHRAASLPEATNLTDVLWGTASQIFDESVTNDCLPLRLLGVGGTRLVLRSAGIQSELFDSGLRRRQQALDETVDAIRGQFGRGAVRRGNLIGRRGDDWTKS